METDASSLMMPFSLPRPRLSPRPRLAPKKVPEAEAPGHRRSRDLRDLLTPGRQKRRSRLCAFGMALTRDAGEGTLAPTSMVDSHSKAPGRLTWMRVYRYMRPRTGKSNGRPGNPWKLTWMRVYRYMRPRRGKLNGRLTWMPYLHPLCLPQRTIARQLLAPLQNLLMTIIGSSTPALISICAPQLFLEFVPNGMTLAQSSLPVVLHSQITRSLPALTLLVRRPNASLSIDYPSSYCRSVVDAAYTAPGFAGSHLVKCPNMRRLKEP